MSCNLSTAIIHENVLYTEYEIYLSEANIKDMNALFDIGAGVSALADALVAWGVIEASTPPGAGLAIASFLWVEKGRINYHANGCGVEIHLYFTDLPEYNVGYQNIKSQ